MESVETWEPGLRCAHGSPRPRKGRTESELRRNLIRLEQIQAPRILLIAGSELQEEQRHDLSF